MIDGVFWAVRSEAGTAIVQFLFAIVPFLCEVFFQVRISSRTWAYVMMLDRQIMVHKESMMCKFNSWVYPD